MESEEACAMHFPSLTRHGKKIFLILVAVNIVIWFIYYRSNNLSHFEFHSKQGTVKKLHSSLRNVSLFHIPLLNVKDMASLYIDVNTNIWCFLEGSDVIESRKRKNCICIKEWYGLDCGIPASVWKSSFLQEGKNAGIEIRRRKNPRRIIMSLVVEDLFDLLDINIQNLFSVVDLFLLIEEVDRNPSLLTMLEEGFLAELQSKIMPFKLNKTVKYNNKHEWGISMLSELWSFGWKRLADFRPDDIILFTHVSSLISKEVLLFLKLYDGYPEPFYFKLRPLVFTFWKQIKNNVSLKLVPFKPLGCTFQFIASLCDYKVMKLFTNKCIQDVRQKALFEKNHWAIQDWIIGDEYSFSGWQCNLCCRDDCVQNKIKTEEWVLKNITASLTFSQKLPNMSMIETILGTKNSSSVRDFNIIPKSDPFYAPKIVFEKGNKYSYLIDQIY